MCFFSMQGGGDTYEPIKLPLWKPDAGGTPFASPFTRDLSLGDLGSNLSVFPSPLLLSSSGSGSFNSPHRPLLPGDGIPPRLELVLRHTERDTQTERDNPREPQRESILTEGQLDRQRGEKR